MEQTDRASTAAPRRPQPGETLPEFQLPSTRGELIGPANYRRRQNLLVLFVGEAPNDQVRQAIQRLAARAADYRAEDGEVIVVAALASERARDFAGRLGVPFPALSDADGAAHRLYGALKPDGRPGLAAYLADRFGQIYQEWLADDRPEALPSPDALLDWLRFIEIQCPE